MLVLDQYLLERFNSLSVSDFEGVLLISTAFFFSLLSFFHQVTHGVNFQLQSLTH